jgi:hypothetical protein
MCSIVWDNLVMQGRTRLDRELLDAGEMARHLVPSGSVFAFLAEHRTELFAACRPGGLGAGAQGAV